MGRSCGTGGRVYDYVGIITVLLIVLQQWLPRIDDVLASKMGAKVLFKLDLSHTYLQLQLEEESKEFVIISTHKALFRYKCLPFGVAVAPGCCTMDDGRNFAGYSQRLIRYP